MKIFAFIAVALCGTGCFCNNESTYHFGIARDSRERISYGALDWNGRMEGLRDDDNDLRVYLPRGVVPEREMIELFDESGPLEIAGILRTDLSDIDGCGANVVTYDLSSLPNGEYLVVHRRSSAPVGLSTLAYPWTEFEGEEALAMTLVRSFQPE